MPRALFALVLALAPCGCGPTHRHATTPVALPEDVEARHAAMDELGRRLFAALADGRPEDALLGDDELRLVLEPQAATRLAARRATLGLRLGEHDFSALSATTYLGVCLEDAHDEPPGGPLGLRATGWTFQRILVAGRQTAGRRVAFWVEGTFLFTDAGFGALDLERVESPRWEHSDLELAPCEMATALR